MERSGRSFVRDLQSARATHARSRCRRWGAVSGRSRCARHRGKHSRHSRVSADRNGNGQARHHGAVGNSRSVRSLPRTCRDWFEPACFKVVAKKIPSRRRLRKPVPRSALFRSSFHRWFAESNTLRDHCQHLDVPRNGIMIMKLQDDTHNQKQTSKHDSLLTDLVQV